MGSQGEAGTTGEWAAGERAPGATRGGADKDRDRVISEFPSDSGTLGILKKNGEKTGEKGEEYNEYQLTVRR